MANSNKNNFIKDNWKIILLITSWLLGTLSLGYITYTSQPPVGSSNIIEAAKIIFLSIGGLGVILPTYINSINTIEERATQKIENTFRLLEKWDDPMIFAARKFTRNLKDEKDSLSDIDLILRINNDDDLKRSIILMVNYFEQIRISEKTKRIDCALFNESIGAIMKDFHSRLRPWIATHGTEFLRDWDELLELSKISK
ncbi:DUF4760 domain-containing protein [Janthinobacterium lividum]|uniref:DUF4760 domain-containing protein n=1 Tax=Janthinobacterium lividum TaxID=29581 RepID=UPI0004454534|nr:hypothetical protein [Janthinobacterium lividum]EZP41412.1 hypothetical protein BW37_00186 [Janthinobacterium lividum]